MKNLAVFAVLTLLGWPSLALAEYAPEISRSPGKEGGVLLFWPRVVPKTSDAKVHELAVSLQLRLQSLIQRVAPSVSVDVRPEPERVCPRDGCLSPTVGVLLFEEKGNCVSVALVSAKGKAPARLIPWGGRVVLKAPTAPFREPPEAQVAVDDFIPCSQLLTSMNEQDGAVFKAIRTELNLPAPTPAPTPSPAPTPAPAPPAK